MKLITFSFPPAKYFWIVLSISFVNRNASIKKSEKNSGFYTLLVYISRIKRIKFWTIDLFQFSLLGVLDGTLIKILQSLEHFAAYTCQKKLWAVILQVTYIKHLKFISVSAVLSRSMHDARVYVNSEIGQSFPDRLAGTDNHIIADLFYPLSKFLLKSYSRASANEVKRLVCL